MVLTPNFSHPPRTISRYPSLKPFQRFKIWLWPRQAHLWIWVKPATLQAVPPQKGMGRQRSVGIVSPSIRRSSESVATVACAKCWFRKTLSCLWMNWWAALCPSTLLCRKSAVLLHVCTSIMCSTKAEVFLSNIQLFVRTFHWFLLVGRHIEDCSQE